MAARLRWPEWVLRVDPVAWFPVVAFFVVAVLGLLADAIWLTLGGTFAAGVILALEAAVFGNDRIAAPPQREVTDRPSEGARPVIPSARAAVGAVRQSPPPRPVRPATPVIAVSDD